MPCLCGLCKQFESSPTPETTVCPDSLSAGGTSASVPCQNNLGGWREGEGVMEGWGGGGEEEEGGTRRPELIILLFFPIILF